MDIDAIARGTAVELALAYRGGQTDPVQLVKHVLEKIERASSENIFIAVSRERALQEAEESRKRYARGAPVSLFDGVPVAWKDIIDVAGTRTTAGSKLLASSDVKEHDAPCVANLKAAGLVTVGKLNTAEFAYTPLGLNAHFGTPRNPHDPVNFRVPGGSSSGAGVAVARGLLPCCIGSDTGGSVRVPAAFNGVVGFKTSVGRIDTTGVVPLARSLDTIGPIARSVEDCIYLDAFLRGNVVAPVRRLDLKLLTVVIPTNVVLNDVEAAILANFERALRLMAEHGTTIRFEKIEALDLITEMTVEHGTLLAAEAYSEYAHLISGPEASLMDRRLVERIGEGRRVTARSLLQIQRDRERIVSQLHKHLHNAMLCMPTTPITAPKLAEIDTDDATLWRVNKLAVRNAGLGNLLDLCSLALPSGTDSSGLPTSLMISACQNEDDRLLGFGLEVERILKSLPG